MQTPVEGSDMVVHDSSRMVTKTEKDRKSLSTKDSYLHSTYRMETRLQGNLDFRFILKRLGAYSSAGALAKPVRVSGSILILGRDFEKIM